MQDQGFGLPFTMNEPVNKNWPWNSGDHGSFSRFMEDKGLSMFSSGHCYLHVASSRIFPSISSL